MSSKCTIDTCQSTIKCKGLCAAHYQAQRIAGLIGKKKSLNCIVANCPRPFYSQDFCVNHYQLMVEGRKNPNRTICMVENCPGSVWREGHCLTHYRAIFDKPVVEKPSCESGKCNEPKYSKTRFCAKHFKMDQAKIARKKEKNRLLREFQKAQVKASKPVCMEDGCDKPLRSMNRCQLHHNQWKAQPTQATDFWEFVKQEMGITA